MKIDPRIVFLGATAALWPGFADADVVPHIPAPQVRLHIQPPKVHVAKPTLNVGVHSPSVHAHSPKIGLSHVPAAGATGHQIKAGHGSIAPGHAHAKVDRTAPSLHAKSSSPSSVSEQTNPKGSTKGSTAPVQKAGLSPASSSSNLASTLISMCPKPCTLSSGGEVVTWGTPGQPGSGSIAWNGTNAQGQPTYEYSVNGGAFPSQLGTLYGTSNKCVGNACDYFFIPKITNTPNVTPPPPSSSPPPSSPHGTGVVNLPPPPPAVSDFDMGSGTKPPSTPAQVSNPVLPPPANSPPAFLPPSLLPPGKPPVVGNPVLPPSASLPNAVLPPSLLPPGKLPMVGNPVLPPPASLPNAVLPSPAGPPRKPVIPVPVRPGSSLASNGSTPSHPPAVFAMPGGTLFAAVYDASKGGYVLPGGVVMPAQSAQLLSNYVSTFKNAPSGGIIGPGVPGGYVAPYSDISGLSP